VLTPVGQLSLWQLSDWMQPIENMKARAALHQSAPSAMARAMSNALAILPAAPIRTRSRTPMPMSALCTKLRPSRIGMPRWSMNSSGAAPVPPFGAVHHHEVGANPGLQDRLANGEKLPRMADAELEPDRLAAACPAHFGNQMQHLDRGGECRVARRRDAVLPPAGTPRMAAISAVDFCGRQDPTMARLGAPG